MCFQLTWQVLISESIIWQISNCLTDMKSESGIDTLVPAAIHPPPRCLDICHIPGGRLVGQSLIALTTGSHCQTPSPYRSSPPPPAPHPFLYPATTHSHTSPLFMNNPGRPTAHCTQLCGGRRHNKRQAARRAALAEQRGSENNGN